MSIFNSYVKLPEGNHWILFRTSHHEKGSDLRISDFVKTKNHAHNPIGMGELPHVWRPSLLWLWWLWAHLHSDICNKEVDPLVIKRGNGHFIELNGGCPIAMFDHRMVTGTCASGYGITSRDKEEWLITVINGLFFLNILYWTLLSSTWLQSSTWTKWTHGFGFPTSSNQSF